jgi:hypothetical protein
MSHETHDEYHNSTVIELFSLKNATCTAFLNDAGGWSTK